MTFVKKGILSAMQQKKNLCAGCSYQQYDEEGGAFCGLAAFTTETTCPRNGRQF